MMNDKSVRYSLKRCAVQKHFALTNDVERQVHTAGSLKLENMVRHALRLTVLRYSVFCAPYHEIEYEFSEASHPA